MTDPSEPASAPDPSAMPTVVAPSVDRPGRFDETSATIIDTTLPPGLDPAAAQRTLTAWSATLRQSPPGADPGITLKSVTQGAPSARATAPWLGPRSAISFPPREAAAAPDPTQHADYVVTRELGRGGMGVVFAADQPAIGRNVALKMLLDHATSDPRAEERFLGEARVTGRLEHPNIVAVYDLGRTRDDRLYLGMKLVRGESWGALLRREPADTPERLRRHLEVLCAVCDAIAYAHSKRVLHRDLKPENVMVGEFGEVQVMDWGLAVELDPDGRVTGQDEGGACGTPSYMSPEQASGEARSLGTWSDVYLLGALLYEVLCGCPPHRGASVIETLFRALQGQVEPPRSRRPGRAIARDLEQLCMSALAVDPAARPASAQELKAGVRRHLAHAEALRLIERARGMVEGPPDDSATTSALVAARLAQALALLDQARELWPDSPDRRELELRARSLQVDLALERGDGRRALEHTDELALAGAPPDRVQALRDAASRQVRRGRNQLIAAVVLVLAVGGGSLGLDIYEDRQAADVRAAAARTSLAGFTTQAWQSVWAARDATGSITHLREEAEAAGWVAECDDPTISTVRAWNSLRAGEPRGAITSLPSPWPTQLEDHLASADRLGPLAAADAWMARPGLPAHVATVGETALLLAAARRASPARLAAEADAIRARLVRSGAAGALMSEHAALPDALAPIAATLCEPPVTASRRTEVPDADGKVRAGLALVVCERATGQVRWQYPDVPALYVIPPLLVRDPDDGGRPLVLLAWGSDLVGLDPATGVVRTRLRLGAQVVALLPAGEGAALAVITAEAGRARSRLVRCTPRRALDRPTPGNDTPSLIGGRNGANQQLVAPGDARPEKDPARLEAELARLDAAATRDPTNPHWPGLRATRLAALGRADEARAAAAAIETADLTGWETAALASRLDELGLHDVALRLAERVVVLEARTGRNADLAPALLGNPVLHLRRMARRAREANDLERALRLVWLGREVSTAIEGDAVAIPVERRWYEANGRPDDAARIARYEPRARVMGGLFLTPHALVEAFDVALVLLIALPFVLLAVVAVIASRSHASRTDDLRALGFRSRASRLAAFVTEPALRLRYTWLAYATRGERAAVLLGCMALLVSNAYLQTVVRKVAQLAAIPIEIGRGHAGHPTTTELVLALKDQAPPDARAPHLRLLAEGALLRDEGPLARAWLDELLALEPDDPFAHANLGLLAEQAGDLDRARLEYGRAAAAPGEPGLVGRANLARLDGQPPVTLPVAYRALERIDPARAAPIRQLATPEDLQRVLDVISSAWSALLRSLSRAPWNADLFDLTMLWNDGQVSADGGDGLKVLQVAVRYGLPLLLLLTLLHLPFGVRASSATSPGTLRRRLGAALDLALPGARWLAEGRALAGAGLIVLLCVVWIVARVGEKGSLLANMAMPEGLVVIGDMSGADLLTSPGLRAIGAPARLLFDAIYLLTWGAAAVRLARLVRARRSAALATPPAPG